jgi:surface protein
MGYFQCHFICKSMTLFIDMLCMMCILKGLVHLICYYSMTLTYFVASYITQNDMFTEASSFNGDISGWDTSKVTGFVSQCRDLLVCFV